MTVLAILLGVVAAFCILMFGAVLGYAAQLKTENEELHEKLDAEALVAISASVMVD